MAADNPSILDLSAGNRAIWVNKQHPDVMFIDIRTEVNPTVVADSRALPTEVGTGYRLVVFDPPHVNFSAGADMSKQYGHHTTEQIREIIRGTAKEAHRVSRSGAFMSFKWNDHDQKLEKVLNLMDTWWEPLFGHKVAIRTKHASATTWMLLRRRETDNAC